MWRRTRKPRPAAEEEAGNPEAAYQAGIRLLAFRAQSRRELTQKLVRRGFADAAVAAALVRLAGLGYLDDAAYARALVRRRAAGRGALLIAAELAARGISNELSRSALDELDPAVQLAAAIRLGERMLGSPAGGGGTEGDAAARLGRRLMRRGFPAAIARQAVNQVAASARSRGLTPT